MKKNDQFTGTAMDLSDKGYGIVKHNGEVVFVPDLLPEESARIVVVHAGKNFSIGKVLERLDASPDRVEAVCANASSCGGCMLQHMDYKAQLAWKKKWMERLFPDLEVKDVIGTNPNSYRNKAQFPVQDGKSGFYKPHSNTVVETETCAIQNPVINSIYSFIRDNLSYPAGLRHIYVRASEKTGDKMVVFIGDVNEYKEIADKLVSAFPGINVLFNRNLRKDNVILGDRVKVLAGKPWMLEDCLGLEIELDFRSFFQVNPDGMEKLYSVALEAADLQPADSVVDMYSGTGTIGLLAARSAGHVTGVEIVPEAVENAKANAKRNGITNAEFVCQDATEFAKGLKEDVDVLFVDPPRKGLSEQGVSDIVRIGPERVVYISCNPQTLKRDLARFSELGYAASWVQPVDLFAQTPGVECVTVLSRQLAG